MSTASLDHAHHGATLPNNLANALKERVASGVHASESKVIRDGLRALFSQKEAVEWWLRTEVVAAYDELRADPSKTISSEDMRAHLSALHAHRVTRALVYSLPAQRQLAYPYLCIAEQSGFPDCAEGYDSAIFDLCDGPVLCDAGLDSTEGL